MTGAMYAAISGLKSHMQKLNVIGNNIANINTPGYKSQSCRFTEALYTTVTAGSNGTDMVGGVNPSQLGYGCNVGTIDLDMGTGNYVPDGDKLHCMIDGAGFFMVGNKPVGTVDGSNTTLDVVKAADMTLTRVGDFKTDSQGYLVDSGGNVLYGFVTCVTGVTPGSAAAEEPSTQLVPIRLPLEPRTGTDPIFPGVNAAGKNVYDNGTGEAALSTGVAIKPDQISIDKDTGKITGVYNGKNYVVGYIPLAQVSNPAGVTHIQGAYYRAGEGAGDCAAAAIGGSVTGNLDNKAADADGAEKIPNTGNTALQTSGLESSGTDLATEISEMITTQRGYQANTRIITVTDSMLEELVNMKR